MSELPKLRFRVFVTYEDSLRLDFKIEKLDQMEVILRALAVFWGESSRMSFSITLGDGDSEGPIIFDWTGFCKDLPDAMNNLWNIRNWKWLEGLQENIR